MIKMSSSTDIEAQQGHHNEITQEFSRENEMRRIRSAGATISPELFEKVPIPTWNDLEVDGSCMSNQSSPSRATFVNGSLTQHPWVSWASP